MPLHQTDGRIESAIRHLIYLSQYSRFGTAGDLFRRNTVLVQVPARMVRLADGNKQRNFRAVRHGCILMPRRSCCEPIKGAWPFMLLPGPTGRMQPNDVRDARACPRAVFRLSVVPCRGPREYQSSRGRLLSLAFYVEKLSNLHDLKSPDRYFCAQSKPRFGLGQMGLSE